MLGEPGLQRLQPPDGAANPVGERRAVQLDTVPGEDLALPVERKVIAIFGDQDMSEKAGRGHALGDRPLRGRRLMNGAAGPAAIAWPADADDTKPRRHMIEHLADGLADQVQFAAAARAGLLSKSIRISSRGRCAGMLARSICDLVLASWPLLAEAWPRPVRYRRRGPQSRAAVGLHQAVRLAGQTGCAAAFARSAAAARSPPAPRRGRCARPQACAPSAAASLHRPAGRQDRCPWDASLARLARRLTEQRVV